MAVNTRMTSVSAVFVFPVLLTIACCVLAETVDHAHGDFDPFNEVLEIYGLKEGQNINSANLSSLIEELIVHKFGCSDQAVAPQSCKTCLTSDNVFTIVSASKNVGLTEEEFEKAAVVVVNYLLDLVNRCKVGGDPSAIPYSQYLTTLQNYGTPTEYHQLVDSLIHKLNETYNPHEEDAAEGQGDGHAHEEPTDKCMNEDRFMSNLEIAADAQLTAENVQRTAAAFIVYFMEGYEFKETCVELPKKEDFLTSIYAQLGASAGSLSESQFIDLLTKLKIGGKTGEKAMPDADPHDHRKKRSTDESLDNQKSLYRWKRSWFDQGIATMEKREEGMALSEELHLAKRAIKRLTAQDCLDVHQLMSIYAIDETDGVTKAKFAEVCPALVQQQISGACEEKPTEPEKTRITSAESFGYGTLMVLLISLLALLGALFVPFLDKEVYKSLIVVFIALAVATMSGDALLHLIPQALGLHEHGSGTGVEIQPFVWKQLVVVASMYLFFLVECIMAFRRKQTVEDSHHGHSHGPPIPTVDLNNGKTDKISPANHPVALTGVKSVNNSVDTVFGVDNPAFEVTGGDLAEISHNSNHNNIRRLSEVTHLETDVVEKKKWTLNDVQSVAVMILIGDTLHNFIDGIAIGAAFAQDLKSGVSTSIAVLCHELPHELGDFAVLISSGMPVRWAMALNFLSACSAFVGLYIGIGISVDVATRQWVFAITAGMFIYVALVNMLPELMNHSAGGRLKTFLLQNVGLLTGFALILLIAVFEEHIVIS